MKEVIRMVLSLQAVGKLMMVKPIVSQAHYNIAVVQKSFW